jgi:hypothetical protein
MSEKILFPISVDSKRFSSTDTQAALNAIPLECEEIIFLVADGLQLYNKATLVSSQNLNNILNNFKIGNQYYTEREKWIKGLKPKILSPLSASTWTITSFSELTDNVFHSIYRNCLIAYFALDNFRNDIIETAKLHRSKYLDFPSDYDTNLSIGYIIEEIALNLRLRVISNIRHEYYMGILPEPLLKLYNDKYDVSIYSICGINKSEEDFFFYQKKIGQSWERVK